MQPGIRNENEIADGIDRRPCRQRVAAPIEQAGWVIPRTIWRTRRSHGFATHANRLIDHGPDLIKVTHSSYQSGGKMLRVRPSRHRADGRNQLLIPAMETANLRPLESGV
jgi:hypothetical protein